MYIRILCKYIQDKNAEWERVCEIQCIHICTYIHKYTLLYIYIQEKDAEWEKVGETEEVKDNYR